MRESTMHHDFAASPCLACNAAITTSLKRTLKLQAKALADTDIARIATFLRIGRERLGRDWEIASDGGHDVLGHLARPLQYEDVIDALSELEHRLSRERGVPPPGARLRLRRWPAHALLQGDADRPRLASFLLSARPVDLDELARRGKVDLSTCEAFVAALMAAGVLEVMEDAASRPDTAGFAAGVPLGEIRRGFGLR